MGDRRESRARRYAQDHGAIGIAWMLVEAEDQVAALEARVARLQRVAVEAVKVERIGSWSNSCGAVLSPKLSAALDEALAALEPGDLPEGE